MARSTVSLFKRPILNRRIVYYVRAWLPAVGRYTAAKSSAVIADAWLAAGGGVSRKNDPLLGEYCCANHNFITGLLKVSPGCPRHN
jgi:hypothetical protein